MGVVLRHDRSSADGIEFVDVAIGQKIQAEHAEYPGSFAVELFSRKLRTSTGDHHGCEHCPLRNQEPRRRKAFAVAPERRIVPMFAEGVHMHRSGHDQRQSWARGRERILPNELVQPLWAGLIVAYAGRGWCRRLWHLGYRAVAKCSCDCKQYQDFHNSLMLITLFSKTAHMLRKRGRVFIAAGR